MAIGENFRKKIYSTQIFIFFVKQSIKKKKIKHTVIQIRIKILL